MTKIIISIFIAAFFLCSCNSQKDKQQGATDRPNIVLIISDDQSWTDYSFMGHEHIKTPRIDQLAAEGLTFSYGYTAVPLCGPSLATIASGLYPYQHGILGNDPVYDRTNRGGTGKGRLTERMEHYQKYTDKYVEINTIADLLGEKGYASLQTGKWWVGNYKNGGFDKGMTHGDPSRGGRHGDEGLTIGREGLDVIYNFIDSTSAQDQPFYIWYAPFLPHSPHTPPDSLKQKYLKVAPTEAVASYWAMCEWFDITCGQLMDYVEEKNLTENTLFIYVTDNGWIQDPDRPNRYAPRSKREPYEMGIRTPIIYKWKDNIEPAMNTRSAVSSIDIATTIYGICGIEPPANLKGINVLDKEALKNRETIFAEAYAHDFSTIDESLYYRVAIEMPYKLILPDPNNKPDAEVELFNIVNDPFEEQNLAGSNTEKVEALKVEIEETFSK